MPNSGATDQSLHDRTMTGLQVVLERVHSHVGGFEKMVVTRAIQMVYPRVEQRIRAAAEGDLRSELQYLHGLLGTILQESQTATARTVNSKRRPKARRHDGTR